MNLQKEVFDKIAVKAAALCQCDPLSLTADIRFAEDLHVKSVDIVKIIAVLEDEYGVEVNFMELRRKKTLGEAAAYIAALVEN